MNVSDGIQIGVAGVLALTFLAVLWYAWEARRQAKASGEMAREMREQRLEGVRPVLSVSCKLYDGKVGKDPSVEVRLRNVGPGVALQIECVFDHPRFAYSPIWLHFLGPQEGTELYRLTRQASGDRNDVDASVGTMAAMVVTYEDIYGRLFETRIAFEQNYVGWTERGTRYALIAGRAPEDRGPPSPNVWHEFKLTSSGSIKEVTDDS